MPKPRSEAGGRVRRLIKARPSVENTCPLENPAHMFKNGKWRECDCVRGQLDLTEDQD